MKIALVNSVCGYGSTGRIVVDQYHHLINNGHDALVVYGRKAGDDAVNAFKMGNRLTTLISVAQTRLFDSHGFNNRAATQALLKKLDAFKPDIIHLHNIHGYYIHVQLLFEYIQKNDIPVVWNLHDCWSFTGHCSHFEYAGCDKWRSGCAKCPQKTEYPASFCLDRSRKNYILKKAAFTLPKKMMLVVPSPWLKGVVKQSFLGEYPISEIPTGIDLDVFRPTDSDRKTQLGLSGKFVLLGAASILSDRKGYPDFLWLAEHLPDDCRMVLAGLSEKQKKRLPKRIIGLTRVGSTEAMAELYSMADVFVNPTKEDTFPTVNLEALACGTPVITYDSGGSKDSLTPKCGSIVPRDDKAGLLDAVLRLKDKPLKPEDCQKQAEQFDRKRQMSKYFDIYRKIYK